MSVRLVMPWKATGPLDVTLLQTRGRAAKLIKPDGMVEPYAAGMWFTPHAVHVETIDDVAVLAERLLWLPDRFMIRGALRKPTKGEVPRRHVDRTTADGRVIEAPFAPCARALLPIDVDDAECPRGHNLADVEQVGAAARRLMPEALRSAACVVARTASAMLKPGLRVRLLYVLDRGISDQEAKRWLAGSPVDLAIYTPTQPIYTSAPVIAEGADDPCPNGRLAVLEGAPEVMVPSLLDPGPGTEGVDASGLWAPLYDPAVAEENFGPDWHAEVYGRGDAYASACLQRLEAAAPGSGRQTLKGVGLAVYGLAKGGLVDPYVVTAEIKRVMLTRGWSDDAEARGHTTGNVNELLRWCWEHATPRGL